MNFRIERMESTSYIECLEEIDTQGFVVQAAICDQCGKGFSNIYTLTAHKKQVHEGYRAFPCGICNTKFATKYKLQRHHLGVHSEKRDFHCETCGNSFKTRDMLVKHQRTHFQGMGPFTCNLCDELFKFKSGLDHHQKLKHTVKAAHLKEAKEKLNFSFKCSFCEKIYKTMKHLERHEELHTTDEQLKCSDSNCAKLFKNSKELTKHEQQVHKEVIYYSCFHCSKIYKSKANFEIHISSHESESNIEELENSDRDNELVHQETLKDEIADAEEAFEDDLLKNIDADMVSVVKIETERFVEPTTEVLDETEIITDDYFIEEVDDGMGFYETIITEDFVQSPTSEDEVIISADEFVHNDANCSNDVDTFKDNDFNTQLMSCEKVRVQRSKKSKLVEDKQSVCDECGATFKNNSHLRRHIQRKHRKDSHKLECDVCGSKFLLNYDLKRHMIKHSSNRDFSCNHCEQKFKTELSLRNHIKVLHNQNEKLSRTYLCKFCNRSYFHQRHLDYHMRKHTGDTRYKCDSCLPEKLFFYSDAVKWHKIRYHGEPSPYSCSICSKKFIHERSLQTHEKDHQAGSQSLAVTCPVCGKSVSEKRHLKRHVRGHTGKNFKCQCGESFKERYQLTK